MSNRATHRPIESPSQILTALLEGYTRAQIEEDMARLTDAIEEHGREEQRHAAEKVEAQRAYRTLEQIMAFVDATQSNDEGDNRPAVSRITHPDDDHLRGLHGLFPERKVTTRERISEVIRAHQEGLEGGERQVWTPRLLMDQFTTRGWAVTGNNLRVTLRRMVERGELQRDADGRYVLPAG